MVLPEIRKNIVMFGHGYKIDAIGRSNWTFVVMIFIILVRALLIRDFMPKRSSGAEQLNQVKL